MDSFWHTRQRKFLGDALEARLQALIFELAVGVHCLLRGAGGVRPHDAREQQGEHGEARATSLRRPIHAPPPRAAAMRGKNSRYPHLLRHGRNEFVNHAALPVHQVGLRRAVDAPIDRRASIAVECHGLIGIAELLKPLLGLVALVLPVEPDDRHDVLLRDLEQRLVFFAAGNAPGGPDIQDIHLPLQRRVADGALGIQDIGERELRRRLADQRRGQRVDVAAWVQAKREQNDQRDECRKRQQEFPHQAIPGFGSRIRRRCGGVRRW